MNFIKPDVQTMCVGIAMSMGSLLLAGGAHGKRSALPNSRILMHQPSSGFEGQATDIEIQAREVLKLRERVDEIYADAPAASRSRRSTATWSATASSRPAQARRVRPDRPRADEPLSDGRAVRRAGPYAAAHEDVRARGWSRAIVLLAALAGRRALRRLGAAADVR